MIASGHACKSLSMKGILADNDVGGQVALIIAILESDDWREVWRSLDVSVKSFFDLGLSPNAQDVVIWHACQLQQVILVTGNRNRRGPESLAAAIEQFNTGQSLPVFTLANSKLLLKSKHYAERVAVRLLQHLLDIDNLLGAGRIFLP